MAIQTRAAAKCCSVFTLEQDGLGISWALLTKPLAPLAWGEQLSLSHLSS